MSDARRGGGPSESVDNYLKAILFLGGPDERRVSGTALATRLQVAPASVTNMLQKLAAASAPMVEYERHRGVRLTANGRRRALEVVRHHRLIETFLFEVLDYPIEEVHDEAERLEHFISERFEERIAAKLGYPSKDPHGHSIPSLTGEMQEAASVRLREAGGVGDCVIASVSDEDGEVLRHLKVLGMVPGAELRIVSCDGAGRCAVRIGGAQNVVELTAAMADGIRVTCAPVAAAV